MSGSFWAGTIPPWAWVLYVAAAGIFLILVIVAELHGRKVGYRQHEEDQADARHEAAIRSWGVRSAEVLHPLEVAHEELTADSYFRGIARALVGTATTNLARDPDDPYDPDDPDEDAPFTVREEWAVPLEYPPEPELLHEWHDHAPLKWNDEGVKGCPACEARWEIPEPAYAYEPWSLSEGTTLMEDVLAMCANADAAPSVRWLAALEAGQ